MTDELSPIAAAIKARPRVAHAFEVQGYLSLGSEVRRVRIRVPTKREQDLAVAGAHEYVSKLGDKAATDPDVLLDAKNAFIVATAVRDDAQPDKLPAFPSGGWVVENMTAEQIGALVNLINEVRKHENPGGWIIDDATVEAIASVCAATAESDFPEKALADKSREFLSTVVVLLAIKLAAARALLDEPATEPAPHEGEGS